MVGLGGGGSYDRFDWIWAAAVALAKSVCKDSNLHLEVGSTYNRTTCSLDSHFGKPETHSGNWRCRFSWFASN